MNQLVSRGILEHRQTIADTLVALSLTDCDSRTLHIVAVAFGVEEELTRRAGTVVLVIDQKIEARK